MSEVDTRTREDRLSDAVGWHDDARIRAEQRAQQAERIVHLLCGGKRWRTALLLAPFGQGLWLGFAIGILFGLGLSEFWP